MSAPDTNARALFAAARDDGPDASDRDALFRRIALSTGIAAGTAAGATVLSLVPAASATGVAAAAAKATTSAGTAATSAAAAAPAAFAIGSKLLALGVALGAVSTALGVIVAVTVGAPERYEAPRIAVRNPSLVAPATTSTGAKLAQPIARKRDTAGTAADADSDSDGDPNAHVSAKAKAEAKTASTVKANANAGANANVAAGSSGDLAEEARLLTAARSALVAGDAARALSLVQATRKLGSRSLEPEELGLEARALRALGRADEAAAAELVLRRRYPDHALARERAARALVRERLLRASVELRPEDAAASA